MGAAKFCTGAAAAGAGEALGPNSAMMESLDILPSVTQLAASCLGLVSAGTEGEELGTAAGAGLADSNPPNSEFKPASDK